MMSDLAAGDGIYVCVGRGDSLDSPEQGVLCASYRMDFWASHTLGNNGLRGIAYGKEMLVAVGDNAAIFQSALG